MTLVEWFELKKWMLVDAAAIAIVSGPLFAIPHEYCKYWIKKKLGGKYE
jgi:hypothetical protein